ncbi:alpha/beta hydrolase [Thiomicrorhabdus sp. ZW0627]|uniref:alpha/beta hydrolase n=1 Tax=Thiomicrorhabdus sp. ZW0627 TaxID=3039774 RepID=UPI00243659B5|nr:alpha/beta hydrolase [Thiomicrorhabdus sp. ZW0627]MDG6774051.1 alpha/beta hydrolase [Thiomicrorhabdus sp. ZW0627]
MYKRFTAICFSIGLLLSYSLAYAGVVTHHFKTLDLTAEAEYQTGNPDKPAVLIMHGFLTTNQFHTIKATVQAFHDAGYTTLAPTLTLNINKRRQSVKCNAIHTHTLEQDQLEISEWIDWLEKKGHKQIILVGHSSGSQELLALLASRKDPFIKLAIFTSLFYLNGEELGTNPAELDYSKKALEAKNNQPHKYSFLFCHNNYYATPESFLSYQKLDRQYILEQLRNLEVPNYTIMGSEDKRYKSVGNNWLDELKQTGTNLVIIEGANHFFSSEYEFDLQDQLVQITNNHFNQP